jgi:hypothetical protein
MKEHPYAASAATACPVADEGWWMNASQIAKYKSQNAKFFWSFRPIIACGFDFYTLT